MLKVLLKVFFVCLFFAVSFVAHSAPASGLKILYLDNLDSSRDLTRVAPVDRTRPPNITVGSSVTIKQTPVFQKPFTVTGGSNIDVKLWLDDRNNNTATRSVRVEVFNGRTGVSLGLSEQTWNTGNRVFLTFSMANATDVTFATGDYVRLVITNISATAGDDIRIDSVRNNRNSRLELQSSTVINVDAIQNYASAYPGTTQYLKYVQGSTVFIRATVSDPFGNTDITGASLTITDVNGTVQVNNAAMTFVATPSGSTRLYEYQYPIAVTAASGTWDLSVTATEGFEGTVTHTATDNLIVGNPDPIFNTSTKTVIDLNGGSAEPGDILQYTITINETGGSSNVSGARVLDVVDANLTGINFTTLPAGSTNNTVGNNIDITNISIPAGGSESIVFEASIVLGVPSATDINNTATISHAASGVSYDAIAPVVTVSAPDLSSTTKVAVDLNGSPALPGDVIEYTITINETGGNAASNVTLTDIVDANYVSINVTSIPTGAVNNSIGNNIDISNISVAANGSATVVFEASIVGSAMTGTTIDNTADIVDIPTGASVSAAAATIFVGSLPTNGIKQLYLESLDVARELTRRVPTQGRTRTNDIGINGSVSIDQTPVFQKPFVITGGSTVSADLWLDDRGCNTVCSARVDLYHGSSGIYIASSSVQTWTNRQYINFPVPVSVNESFSTGDFIRIVVNNVSTNPGDDFRVESERGGTFSQLRIQTDTVINVDVIDVYAGTYPATTQYLKYAQGSTVYIRATVTDPFGNADITAANITVTDSNGSVQVNNVAMSSVATPTGATRTFEYQYTIPVTGISGEWSLSVTAAEGAEGTIFHTAQDFMTVGNPDPIFDTSTKAVQDLNGAAAEPGDILEYTITINETGGSNVSNAQLLDVVDANLSALNIISIPAGATDNTAGNNIDISGIAISPGGSVAVVFQATITAGTAANTNINNKATISHAASAVSYEVTAPTLIVLAPNLSTSSKVELDVNGPPAQLGDLIRYTITINETGGWPATSVTLTDTVSALLTGLNITSIPTGATDNTTGNNISISNISIAANGSVTVVFEANIINTASVGDAIDNTASIVDGPTGANASLAAGTIFVSSLPGSGDKLLYLDNLDTTLDLTRVPPVVRTRPPDINVGSTISITQTPVFQTPFTVTGGNSVVIELWLRDRGAGGSRTARVDLYNGNTGILIGSDTQTWTGRVYVVFTIAVATDQNFAIGDYVQLDLTNTPASNGRIRLDSVRNGQNSQITMTSNTVINVDAIGVFAEAYPGTLQYPSYAPGSTVYIRSTVSDPFGNADISSADITITDSTTPTPVVRVNNQAMVSVATATAATKVYEYQYTIPATPEGQWDISITANEGSEGTVSHTARSPMIVSLLSPDLVVSKSSLVLSDPVNTINPKVISGAIIEYSIAVENKGLGTIDIDTTVITFPVASGTNFYFGAPLKPATFVDGAVSSGLSYSFIDLSSITDDIDFSNDGGNSYITPSVDINGFDITVPPVNFIRLNPKGEFRASDGVNNPSMVMKYRVNIK